MDYLRIIEEREEELKREQRPLTIEAIPLLTLSEFEERDLAVEVYSGFLDEIISFCSNEKMASQIKQDDPEAIVYTASELDELKELSLLEPSNEMLKGINNVKAVFEDSRIIKTCRKLKE